MRTGKKGYDFHLRDDAGGGRGRGGGGGGGLVGTARPYCQ